MQDDSIGSISQLLRMFMSGDRESVQHLWNRFFPRMMNLANMVLKERQLPAGAEDAVQEAFLKFIMQVENGHYRQQLRRDDLWRILTLFTVQTARKQMIREQAAKRGGGRVKKESELIQTTSRGFRLDGVIAKLPAADCDLLFEELLGLLDDDLKEIALLRLGGYTLQQIQTQLGCSLRSAERRIQLIRAIWREWFIATNQAGDP